MRILIVGGGIAGLALAGLLDKQGIDATVVEKRPQNNEAGYSMGIWFNGTRILDQRGVGGIFRKNRVPFSFPSPGHYPALHPNLSLHENIY